MCASEWKPPLRLHARFALALSLRTLTSPPVAYSVKYLSLQSWAVLRVFNFTQRGQWVGKPRVPVQLGSIDVIHPWDPGWACKEKRQVGCRWLEGASSLLAPDPWLHQAPPQPRLQQPYSLRCHSHHFPPIHNRVDTTICTRVAFLSFFLFAAARVHAVPCAPCFSLWPGTTTRVDFLMMMARSDPRQCMEMVHRTFCSRLARVSSALDWKAASAVRPRRPAATNHSLVRVGCAGFRGLTVELQL
jgi:hypothetical protein